MTKNIFLFLLCGLPVALRAQVNVEKGAVLFLGPEAALTVQGNFDSDEDIEGVGTIILNGTDSQTLHLSNSRLPRVLVDNGNGIKISSPLKINKELTLNKGNLRLNGHSLHLGNELVIEGNANAYIQTGNNGRVILSVQSDLSGLMLPIGTADAYTPLLIRSKGAYANAAIEIGARSFASPDKPIASTDYLTHYWTVARNGIKGDVVATAFYDKVSGEEENIRPFYWNGRDWLSKQTPVNTRDRSFSVGVPEGTGQIYAMRKEDDLLPAKNTMTLLPNPVKNIATLIVNSTSDDHTTLRITDNRGGTVRTQQLNLQKGINQVRINVVDLANGHYTVSSSLKDSRPISMIKN
jgi:hypothetical protein